MSVWTKVKTAVLEKNVDLTILEDSLKKELNVTLDYDNKVIENYYGVEKVDATLKHKNNLTSLGIVINDNKGIDIVGDTWQSGIVKDNEHDKLANMISQNYQLYKLKKELELNGWQINTVKQDNKIKLSCTQW